MASSGSIPWHNRPPRSFPAKEWLERRYGFRLPPLCCATPRPPIDAWAPRRDFPVKRWLAAHPLLAAPPTLAGEESQRNLAACCLEGRASDAACGAGWHAAPATTP